MEDQLVVPTTEAQAEQVTPASTTNALMDFLLNDGQNNQQQAQQTPSSEAATTTTKPEEEEELLDPKDWVKREFGVDDVEVLRQEREEYRQLKEKKPAPEFTNEDSRKAYEYVAENKWDELYDVLASRKKIEKLSSADLSSNKELVSELVKFSIKNDNPTLNDDDVEFLYNEKYSLPSKPVKDDMDDDTDYEAKVSAWQNQVNNIEKRMLIEAKMAQPKVAQLKSEIVFPDIKGNQQNLPTQEDLAAIKQMQESFIKSSEPLVNSFTGFNVQVKDKDVDFAVNYTPSTDERKLLSDTLTKLADSGFDANEIFVDRWYDVENKTFKIEQMTKDLSRILMGENSDQKLAMDSANKRMDAFLAEKRNVSVTEGNKDSTFKPDADKTQSQKLADAYWN